MTNIEHPSLIKNIIANASNFLLIHKTWAAVLLVLVLGIFALGVFSKPSVNQDTYTVVKNEIMQSVSVSGAVEASKEADLSFQVGGQVAYVGVKVGSKVNQGAVLATLQAGTAQASVLDAEALLANRRATLGQLEEGSRKEELAIKEQVVENALASLSQAYSSLPDVIKNTDSVTSDTIKSKFSNLFIFNGTQYVLSFSSCDQQLQGALEKKRTELEDVLADFQRKSGVVSVISSQETLDVAFTAAYQTANLSNEVVNGISQLLLSSCSITNSSLDGYRSNLSLVKTSMNSLFIDLASKRSSLLTAKNSYAQASRDLELSKAGTNPFTLKAQMALVSQAEALLAQAKANLQKTVIRAPFKGVISSVSLTEGETASMNSPVISMIAEDGFEIEAKVPEIDIVKIKVGARVDVTLDAYGNGEVFQATITRINPTATTEGTVPVYKVIVTFVGEDERVKQGMTANVKIITAQKSSVYAVPARFITVLTGNGGQAIVANLGKEELRDVALGLRGEGGFIEVTEGLFEGDVLLPPKTTVREAQKLNN